MKTKFLEILPFKLSILRLAVSDEIPPIVLKSKFYSISKSDRELSIVAEYRYLKRYLEKPIIWRSIRFKGVLGFVAIGVLARITAILAEAKVSTLCISTYDTDYVLVHIEDLEKAVEALSTHYSIFRL